jgi:hypothetical protein
VVDEAGIDQRLRGQPDPEPVALPDAAAGVPRAQGG